MGLKYAAKHTSQIFIVVLATRKAIRSFDRWKVLFANRLRKFGIPHEACKIMQVLQDVDLVRSLGLLWLAEKCDSHFINSHVPHLRV